LAVLDAIPETSADDLRGRHGDILQATTRTAFNAVRRAFPRVDTPAVQLISLFHVDDTRGTATLQSQARNGAWTRFRDMDVWRVPALFAALANDPLLAAVRATLLNAAPILPPGDAATWPGVVEDRNIMFDALRQLLDTNLAPEDVTPAQLVMSVTLLESVWKTIQDAALPQTLRAQHTLFGILLIRHYVLLGIDQALRIGHIPMAAAVGYRATFASLRGPGYEFLAAAPAVVPPAGPPATVAPLTPAALPGTTPAVVVPATPVVPAAAPVLVYEKLDTDLFQRGLDRRLQLLLTPTYPVVTAPHLKTWGETSKAFGDAFTVPGNVLAPNDALRRRIAARDNLPALRIIVEAVVDSPPLWRAVAREANAAAARLHLVAGIDATEPDTIRVAFHEPAVAAAAATSGIDGAQIKAYVILTQNLASQLISPDIIAMEQFLLDLRNQIDAAMVVPAPPARRVPLIPVARPPAPPLRTVPPTPQEYAADYLARARRDWIDPAGKIREAHYPQEDNAVWRQNPERTLHEQWRSISVDTPVQRHTEAIARHDRAEFMAFSHARRLFERAERARDRGRPFAGY
jgi:hypothetical protein